jgi:mono/diheme cytochrome c family protein
VKSLAFVLAAAVTTLCLACRKPLPEQGTSVEQLYAQRCGSCHRAYSPASMTAAMWEMQLDAMRVKMLQAGQAPLSADEQREILDYLQRNASMTR